MTNNTDTQTTTTGYICKECSSASPIGVGYTHTAPGAREASAALMSCECGYSVSLSRLIEGTDSEETVARLISEAPEGATIGVRKSNAQGWDITWTLTDAGWTINVPAAPSLGRPYETRSADDWARALKVTAVCGDVVVIAY